MYSQNKFTGKLIPGWKTFSCFLTMKKCISCKEFSKVFFSLLYYYNNETIIKTRMACKRNLAAYARFNDA